jgi:methylated-DNA-[protein]-cysteine S-methyltransferase
MVGTDFQKEVWKALMQVPYGRTATYSELAENINAKESVRAVAGANGANAIAIIIPCHRIVGSDGDLTGYGGGIAVKKRILNMEKKNS